MPHVRFYRQQAPHFQNASKKERTQTLDQITHLTGYTRCYAAFVLRSCGRRHVKVLDGGTRRVFFIPGHCRAVGAARQQLLSVSPAIADRLLVKTKALARVKGRSGTRPGSLLKHHVPVRTFPDWSDARPGFCEADLVAHDG